MARPVESVSGLARERKTVRIDPALAFVAKSRGLSYSGLLEKAIVSEVVLDGLLTEEVVKAVLLSEFHSKEFQTMRFEKLSDLGGAALFWEGRSIPEITSELNEFPAGDSGYDTNESLTLFSCLIQLAFNPDEEIIRFGFEKHGRKIEDPENIRSFYCEETDQYGIVYLK